MAGVPSIVYGLFGLALFVIVFGFGVSILSGALTLACLTLPVIITSTEEALRQVPQDLRQAALALGRHAVADDPDSGTSRRRAGHRHRRDPRAVARRRRDGAGALHRGVLPGSAAALALDKVMVLPYHIYIMATQPSKPAPHVVWGAALVLVAGITVVNIVAAAWRARARRKVTW